MYFYVVIIIQRLYQNFCFLFLDIWKKKRKNSDSIVSLSLLSILTPSHSVKYTYFFLFPFLSFVRVYYLCEFLLWFCQIRVYLFIYFTFRTISLLSNKIWYIFKKILIIDEYGSNVQSGHGCCPGARLCARHGADSNALRVALWREECFS